MTPWRSELYKKIEKMTLHGHILDLGGSYESGYLERIKGDHDLTVVNLDPKTKPDYSFDLEEKFPLSSKQYDAVMAINLLEHIFNHRQLCDESFRILKDSGVFIIGVPFLIQFHPSPGDFWRYTEQSLRRILLDSGFRKVEIEGVGSGPFLACAQILHGILKFNLLQIPLIFVCRILDGALSLLMPFAELIRRYPLGYIVKAYK